VNWSVRGDWGTSRLRLYRIEDGQVVDRREGPGIGLLEQSPQATLAGLLEPWRGDGAPSRITLCGMAGARSGLREAPYAPCPVGREDWRRLSLDFALDGVPVRIAAGLSVTPADVMRGEETQIFGALARDPGLGRGKVRFVLPGTHSKWAEVTGGTVHSFKTFPTGELFALLAGHSTLVGTGAGVAADEAAGWHEGLGRGLEDPALLGSLFRARSAQLAEGRTSDWAAGYVSGLLIGSEVALALSCGEADTRIVVIGADGLTAKYREAISAHHLTPRNDDGDACVLAGLELLDGLDR
jgi:2-dehydro-3-deoxygalactonokinase